MNRKARVPIVALMAGGIALAGFLLGRDHADGAALVLYGNVDIREVELAFRQPGRVSGLTVDEGASVREGELLAELDDTPYRDMMLAAQASVAQAVAELEKLRSGSRSQEIAQAREAVRQAEAAAIEAEREHERQNSLVESGAVSARAADVARSARDRSRAALAAARQALSLLLEGARQEDIAVAEARLAAAEAQLAQARTALADTRLVSPSDAVVSTRMREVGSMVTANTPIYALSLQEPVYVRAYVSQPQLTRLRPGGAVTIMIDGSDERLAGTVGFISPRAEFTPKSVETAELRTDLVYRVRIVVPGGARILRQGMPVTVQVDEGGVSVPTLAPLGTALPPIPSLQLSPRGGEGNMPPSPVCGRGAGERVGAVPALGRPGGGESAGRTP
ncbi:MAG: secretion protein HlyD [Azoarcus sp.]|nr:secretion protein HlyD [Azoarcus sp.]